MKLLITQPVGAAPTTSSSSNLTPGFNILQRQLQDERETFKFWNLVRLILDICW